MRFRRSVRLGPGLRMNASRSGLSVTFGPRGYHHTISTSGRRTTTVGLPGSGLYWQETRGGHTAARRATPPRPARSSRALQTGAPAAAFPVTHAGLFAPRYEKEFARALADLVAGRKDEALEHFERSVVKDSKQRSSADELLAGAICVNLGREVDAIPYLERVVSQRDELPDALMRHYLPGGMSVAIGIDDHLRVTLPLGSVAAALMLSTAYDKAGRSDEAIGVLQKLAGVHPDPVVKLMLCMAHAHKSEWRDVVTVAAGATNTDDVGLALCAVEAEALCALGLPDGALQALANALRSPSRNPELLKAARYLRARAYGLLGQPARARKELEQLYAIDPAYRDVAALLGGNESAPSARSLDSAAAGSCG
jgi:tetratricopeptide (TPR) repeat protein